jgi:hypothetical protein
MGSVLGGQTSASRLMLSRTFDCTLYLPES